MPSAGHIKNNKEQKTPAERRFPYFSDFYLNLTSSGYTNTRYIFTQEVLSC